MGLPSGRLFVDRLATIVYIAAMDRATPVVVVAKRRLARVSRLGTGRHPAALNGALPRAHHTGAEGVSVVLVAAGLETALDDCV